MRSKNLQDMALDEISNEIDIGRLIKASRVSALMTKMFLKPNQTKLVKFFKRYQVDSDGEDAPEERPQPDSASDLLRDFNPDKDPLDKLIAQELLGAEADNDETDPDMGNLLLQRSQADRNYSLIN